MGFAFRPVMAAGLLVAAIARASSPAAAQSLVELARQSGQPTIPGLNIVYLHPLSDPASAPWVNILVHQTEGPHARVLALLQAHNPARRGVTLWVEPDGTIYWSTPENAIPTQGNGANRRDNKYIDNSLTYHKVLKTNSLGIEFAGNYPDVTKPVSAEQTRVWLILAPFLQERYGIPSDHIYAHNWIDHKDRRYCEGCALAEAARALNYEPTPRTAPSHSAR